MKRKSPLRWFRLFVSLPVSVLLLAFAFSQNRNHRIEAHRQALTAMLGSVSAAATVYAEEHNHHLPPVANWEQALQPNTGPIPLNLPPTPGGAGRRIALNRALAGRDLTTLAHPEQAILFYESTSETSSACDDLTSLILPGDPSPLVFGFADGHIEEFPTSRREQVLANSRR